MCDLVPTSDIVSDVFSYVLYDVVSNAISDIVSHVVFDNVSGVEIFNMAVWMDFIALIYHKKIHIIKNVCSLKEVNNYLQIIFVRSKCCHQFEKLTSNKETVEIL